MGAEPYLIASTLEAVLAQRLVRVICKNCRETYHPSEKELAELNLSPEEIKNRTFYQGIGCKECNNSGYKGRTGIFELLIVNEAFRSLIVERPQIGLLRNLAKEIGMRTLREDGLKKVYEGITTIEELIRETQ
jgi:type IV pilus assembly protein PilB